MEVFWITFRVEQDASYQRRYDALVEAVKGHAYEAWWAEPTSFWLIGSYSERAELAAAIKGAIDPRKDLALIGSMQYTGATLIGKATYLAELKKLEPKLRIA